MKRTLIGTCAAAALGLALTASAQQPPQPQPSQPTPPAQASAALDRETKLSGCLKSGPGGTFELATGKKDKSPSASDAANPSQPPASSSSQAPAQDAMSKAGSKNVKLAAGAGVELAAHLNHQIEVTGSWDKAAGDAASSAMKTFNVTAVKMVSATCTTGTN
jgi:hypothetical protein